MVPMLLALYGHPDSGGIWEQHLNSCVVKQGWKQILPDIWHSIFHHQELNCLLVATLMTSRWQDLQRTFQKLGQLSKQQLTSASLKRMTAILVACARNLQTPDCRKKHMRFAFAFEAKSSVVAQHRTQDWWEHDEAINKAWIRHHIQPRKRLYQPGDEGGESTCKNKRA